MLNSIKNRLLAFFTIFSIFLVLTIILVNTAYFKKKERQDHLIARYTQLENDLLKLFNNSGVFFRNDINNTTFFQSGNSKYLVNHEVQVNTLLKELRQLKKLKSAQGSIIGAIADNLVMDLTEYNLIFTH